MQFIEAKVESSCDVSNENIGQGGTNAMGIVIVGEESGDYGGDFSFSEKGDFVSG